MLWVTKRNARKFRCCNYQFRIVEQAYFLLFNETVLARSPWPFSTQQTFREKEIFYYAQLFQSWTSFLRERFGRFPRFKKIARGTFIRPIIGALFNKRWRWFKDLRVADPSISSIHLRVPYLLDPFVRTCLLKLLIWLWISWRISRFYRFHTISTTHLLRLIFHSQLLAPTSKPPTPLSFLRRCEVWTEIPDASVEAIKQVIANKGAALTLHFTGKGKQRGHFKLHRNFRPLYRVLVDDGAPDALLFRIQSI